MPTINTIDDVSNIRSISAAVTANAGAIAIQNINGALKQVDDQGTVTSIGGGGGLTPIADQTTLANISGGSAIPTATTATQMRTMLSIQASSAVAITGGTITGTTIALAPAQLSDGLISVTGSTGVLTNPTLTGLTGTAGALSNNLITGLSGGQTIKGDTAASGNLIATSTNSGTKGHVKLGDGTGQVIDMYEFSGRVDVTAPSGSGTLFLLLSSANTTSTFQVNSSSTGVSATANIEQHCGAADYFSQMSGSGFSGTPGRLIQTLSGASGDWYHQIHQAAGDYVWQTTTSDTTRMTLSNAGVLTYAASLVLQLGTATLDTNNTVATVLGSVGPTGAHTTVQEWMKVKGTGGADRWIPMF